MENLPPPGRLGIAGAGLPAGAGGGPLPAELPSDPYDTVYYEKN